MVYVPTCQTSAKFSFARVNGLINVPTCQRCVNYSIWLANVPKGCYFQIRLPKGVPNFQLFFNRIFQFLNFSIMLNPNFKKIWAILENLSRETKNLNSGICKISLRKNVPKSLTSFSVEHVGLTEQLFIYCETELNIFFLPNFIHCV